MVNPRIDGNNVFIENCSDEKIKLTNCDELGNVIKSQFDLYDGKKIIFRDCPNLKKITADCLNLTGLQIENCPNLEKLSAYYNKIEKVDLSNLKNLKVVNLNNGVLENISLSGCENLQELYTSNNSLENLDLTDNNKLRILYCSYNEIDWLEVKHLEQLKTLHCENCNLEELDCSDLGKLENLFCFDNGYLSEKGEFKGLNKINIDNCELLEVLDCAENGLEELELSKYSKLHTLSCRANKIENLIINDCSELAHLDFSLQGEKGVLLEKNVLGDDMYKLFIKSPIFTNLYIRNSYNLEKILHTKGAKFLSLSAEPEPILFDKFNFPKLKDFGIGAENDLTFEEYLDKKREKEQRGNNFDEGYESDGEKEISAVDFKVPADKDDLEYFGVLAGMRIKGKLVIEGWANLIMLNVGNNQLEHLVVKDCPNLRSVIYSHNKLKRVEIINCPNLSQEYSHGSDNWDAPELTEEEQIQLEQKKEEVNKKQEANDKVYLILQKKEEDVDLDEMCQLLKEVDVELVDKSYIEKFVALYHKKLKERFPQFYKNKPIENENKPDYEKLYFELLAKIENGELISRDEIANSQLSSKQKEKLYNLLTEKEVAQKNLTTPERLNYLPYILGGLGVVLVLVVLIRKRKRMKFFKENLKK